MSDWFAGDAGVRYDESTGDEFEPATIEATVDFLLPLARGGALELAIGTGRIAVPLAARGVRVAGIDLSPTWSRSSGARRTRSTRSSAT